jgi:tripartite-type tricarboxylate transporter receptor subunit TctC
VPAATPRPIIDRINNWFIEVIGTPETKQFLNQFGGDPYLATPDEAQAALLQDIKDWEGYVRAARVEPQG